MSKIIATNPGVLSFPAIWEPKPDPNERMKYSATLIFKSEADLKPLKDAAEVLLKQKFPTGKLPKNFKFPWRPNEEYSEKTGYEDPDGWFVQFSRNAEYGAPPVVGPGNTPLDDRGLIYPGCIVRCGVKPYVWAHKQTAKNGISFSLECVKYVGEGQAIAGYGPVDVDEVFSAEDQADLNAALS